MAYELYYTSAPRGLRPQTSGICTVGLTRGFPAPFIPRIEALSGYRKPSDNAELSECPIAFSHWVVEGGGVNRHVLSTVRMAPPDHTGRSNKFAHHLLLREDECVAPGPAWLLQQAGVVADSWTGEPRELPHEKRMPIAGRVIAGICASWQRAGGDAGWAGVLANAAMLDPTKVCAVIVPRGTDSLALIAEAMLLLPTELRWRVTFTSYFMEPIAGVRCSWRFCRDGTPAAAAARAGGGTCIDLCLGAPCTRTGRFIDFARTGVIPKKAAAPETQSESENHSGGDSALTPDRPVDLEAVLGRQATHSPRLQSIGDDRPRDEHRQRKMTVAFAACAAFFALLSFILLLLLMQSEKLASTTPLSAVAPATSPVKIPDSQPVPIQPVVEPSVSQREKELAQNLQTATDRIADLERQLAAAKVDLPSPTRVERGTPALGAAQPKAFMGDRARVMPTVSAGWLVKVLPVAQKDSFGAWSGSEKLVECPEGAEWQWLGSKERGSFGFDGQGITMRRGQPGAPPARIAELKCEDGWLMLKWTVTSEVDSSEQGWYERLKREIKHLGLLVSTPGGISAEWICFSKPQVIIVTSEPTVPLPVQGASRCAAANGVWDDVGATLSINIPGCEQYGAVVIRDVRRTSADTRIVEVFFEWPAELSDASLKRVKDEIVELREKLTIAQQSLLLQGTGQDADSRKEQERLKRDIKQMESALAEQEASRSSIEGHRKTIAGCVQGKTLLFGPNDGIPTIEFTLRIDRPTEVRK